jgi:hypothetical protein
VIRGIAALAVAIPLAVIVTACGGASGGRSATPVPSGPVASPLTAGTHTSTAFQPAVTYTVPDGWTKPTDAAVYMQLQPAGSEVTGIHFFRNALAASQDPTCPSQPQPGVGKTASELVAWIRTLPGLTVSTPAMVTVGGLPGLAIDVAIKPGWTQSCPFANGNPTVALLSGGGAGYHWIVVGNERLRLSVLDTTDGGTVITDVDAFDGTLFEQLIASSLPVIKSLHFAAS